MNIIEKMFPVWALKRKQAEVVLKNYYEAAVKTDYHKRRTDISSGDSAVRTAGEQLRIQARHLEQNLDIAKGALDSLVANIVGMGVRPEFQLKTESGDLAEEINANLLKMWNNWIANPEVTGELDFYAAQRLACRSWLRDGEIFTQILRGNVRTLNHRTTIPLSIELIESDLVPYDYEDVDKNIIQGVQKNAWGEPKTYFVYKEHPGNAVTMVTRKDLKTISGDNMLHLKLFDRVKQTRGVSAFATVLNRFDDIKDIEESERVAARVAAAMTGYIKKGTPDLYQPTGDDFRQIDMEPGMIFDDLLPGEDIGTIISNRPNNQLIPFREAQLRAAAAGLGTSFSTLARNYNGTYAAQRQELVEQYGVYGIMWSMFSERWVRKIINAFQDMALLSGAIVGDFNEASLYDVELSRPALVHIDPFKEATASERLVAAGFMSRSQVQRAHGKNPEDTFRQIVKERKEAEKAGVIFSTDSGTIVQPQQQVGSDSTKTDQRDNEDEADAEET